ncbi:MAG TPA: hypothetical protein VJT31_02435 [Rugosimonospora sp.]|nr:hypothetical protein [Rugosimonospora sp.]
MADSHAPFPPAAPPHPTVDVDQVLDLLRAHRFGYANEREFHAGIEAVLRAAAIATQREVVLSPRDRIDFLLPGGLGIEVKLAGTPGDVLRQLRRYAASPLVTGLLLVTSRARHVHGLPERLDDTPLRFLLVRGGL